MIVKWRTQLQNLRRDQIRIMSIIEEDDQFRMRISLKYCIQMDGNEEETEWESVLNVTSWI